MCRAVTCLSYCIAVTTKSLLFAAEAYPTLEPTLRFLDLVSLRVRRGTLQVSNTAAADASALGRFPFELWELVRHELVELELFWAEQRIARNLLCPACQASTAANKVLFWRFPETEARCGMCSDAECTFEGILQPRYKSTIQRDLMAPFDLCLPTCFSVRQSNSQQEYAPFLSADSRTATFIALAPSWAGVEANALEQNCEAGNYDYADEQSVVDVSFRVPPGANERFKALVKRYHLQPVQISDGILAHKHTKKAMQSAALKGSGRVFRLTKAVRPRWKLFLTCETNW